MPLLIGVGPRAKRERVVVAVGVELANSEVAAAF